MSNGFVTHDGLSPEAKKVAKAIVRHLTKQLGRKPDRGGGCSAFYSPEEWRDRGEQYGTDSVLIIVHEGGDFHRVCTLDGNYESGASYDGFEAFKAEMERLGYICEQCTTWYSAVYRA